MPELPTPTAAVALPPEGALVGLRDGPTWLNAVGEWLRHVDPALPAAGSGTLIGAAEAPALWLAQADRAAVAWPAADLAWRFGADGCGVFVPATATELAAAPCSAADEAAATLQVGLLALARPPLAAGLRIDMLAVQGSGADAVVTATVALPGWRARWQVRGHANGRLLALAWPSASAELTRRGADWQLSRSGVVQFGIRFGAAARQVGGAVLQVPYDGGGDPHVALAGAAQKAGLLPLGPTVIVLDWQPPRLRLMAAQRAVLAPPRDLGAGAAVRTVVPAAPALARPVVLSHQTATVALAQAPAGCIEALLLGDALDDRGRPRPGASVAVIRRCSSADPTSRGPAEPDRP